MQGGPQQNSISELKFNQVNVQQICEVVAAVLEFEVVIIDERLEVIAGTGKYGHEVGTVYGTSSITGKLLPTEDINYILDDDPKQHLVCKDCDYKNTCNLKAGLYCTIKYCDRKLGTISLLAFDEEQKEELLNNRGKLLDFLNKMAALISSKIGEQEMHNQLSLMADQFSAVIDSVLEGIIAVDRSGYITHVNKSAEGLLFSRTDQLIGKHMSDVFMGTSLPKNSELGRAYSEHELMYKNNEQMYRYISTVTPIRNGKEIAGSVISFRSVSEMRKLAGRIIREERKYTLDGILGTSKIITDLKQKMRMVANTDSTILITGESGTGKELFARAIHEESPRKGSPFIAINCGAIPENLLESELFGYEDGAFTGAKRGGKPGKFELADGGSIFLDEIGDMPLHLQVKLLRVIQELSVEPIGSIRQVRVDVRIIAATNRNLEEMIRTRQFRSDLFYRLSVIPFFIPPLRERSEDLVLLLHYFLDKYNLTLGKRITGFTKEAEQKILAYPWPGNVRELENAVEYAVNIATNGQVDVACLPTRILDFCMQNVTSDTQHGITTMVEIERNAIINALKRFGNSGSDKAKAAQSLGMSRSTFYRKLKELGFGKEI